MQNTNSTFTRREFTKTVAGTTIATVATNLLPSVARADGEKPFELNYILGSCMYGYADLKEILPEVAKTGATAIDIWPKVHGNQREQLSAMGEEKFEDLLQGNKVKLGCITQYHLGPFGLQTEMRLAKRLGCRTIVTGGSGPTGLKGMELKAAVQKFVEQMKPHLAVAEETGVTIAIENHGNNLIDSPDSLKWLAELRSSKNLGIAFAPYHLPQEEDLLARLIRELGDSIAMFYAWQHGKGCMKKQPKADELLQMPGRGDLDFAPLLAALKKMEYDGWTEIFMHPFPRGIAILEDTAATTTEINAARNYLTEILKKT